MRLNILSNDRCRTQSLREFVHAQQAVATDEEYEEYGDFEEIASAKELFTYLLGHWRAIKQKGKAGEPTDLGDLNLGVKYFEGSKSGIYRFGLYYRENERPTPINIPGLGKIDGVQLLNDGDAATEVWAINVAKVSMTDLNDLVRIGLGLSRAQKRQRKPRLSAAQIERLMRWRLDGSKWEDEALVPGDVDRAKRLMNLLAQGLNGEILRQTLGERNVKLIIAGHQLQKNRGWTRRELMSLICGSITGGQLLGAANMPVITVPRNIAAKTGLMLTKHAFKDIT